MSHLHLALLGSFDAKRDGLPLEGLGSDRLRGLLSYLAVESGQEHPRQHVASLLWPERSDAEAMTALRSALSNLRAALGDRALASPFVLVTRTHVQFSASSDHWLDVAEFESLKGQTDVASLERAATLYRGPFLHGLSVEDSPAFDDWLLVKGEEYRRDALGVMERLASLQLAGGEYREAVRWARRQVEIEPYREQAHRQMMVALALGRERGAALAQYEACRRLLDEELGCEPEDETEALYAQIRDGVLARSSPVVVMAATGQPQAKSKSRFVSREQELARLDVLLGRALTGAGGVALVSGEAGSGKTALLEEWGRRAAQKHGDLIVLRGNCSAHGGAGDPYLPFREMLQTLAGDVEGKRACGALTPEQARRVWEALPAVGAALVEHGPDLIDRFVPGEALLRRAEGFPSPTGASHWQAHLRQIVGRGGIGTLAQTASGLGASSSQPDLFAQVTQVLHALSLRRPLLLQVDDLQWADGGTAALLFHLGRRLAGSRLLLACAFRPEALLREQGGQGGASGIGVVLQELRREWGEVLVDLDKADGRAFVDAYLDSQPNWLGQGFRQALYEHTEGNPLFTVELLRRFERDGTLVQDEEGKWVEAAGPDWERWPPQVEAVIAGHLAGLADEDLALLQAASVQGEQFVAEAAARVVGLGEDSVLRRLGGSLRSKHRLVEAVSLERLEGSGQRLSRYRFRHSLLQRSAYRSLDPAVRAGLHEMTGRALEAIFASPDAKLAGEGPQLLMTELAPELARHFEEAGLPLDAARHRLEAGRWAARLVAYDESIAHLERGLALLEETKSSRERLRLELSLWTAMVNPALLQGGWRSLSYRQAMDRLSILAQHPDLCGDPQTVSALAMLALTVAWSADPLRGRQLGEQLLGQAHDGDEQTLMLANWVRGHSYFWQGDLAAAYVNLSQALALHGQKAGRPLSLVLNSDPTVVGLAMLGYLRWLLGYPDQGQDSFQQALSQAQAIAQPPTTAFVHVMVGMAHFILGRNAGAAHSHGAALQTLSQEGLFYHGFVEVLAARDGQTGEVEPELVPDRGAASGRGTSLLTVGTGTGQTGRFLVQAHMCAQAGRFALALQALDEAQAWIDETGVKILEAEVWRMRGELLLARSESDGAGEAEVCFRRALELASTQQARWLELRAAVSLARLWQRQGRREDALDLLTGIYNWFTEGFDTVDLVEAKQLWQELG